MAKEFEFGIESLAADVEGVNLKTADRLIVDLGEVLDSGREINEATRKALLKDTQAEIKVLMDLQRALGPKPPQEIGIALTKLRDFQNKMLETEAA